MSEKISIKKNYIFNVSYQILNLIVPLITTPYISRVLGVEGIGEYSYIGSIVTYFITLAILGSTPYAQREIAYQKDDRQKRSLLFWEMVIFRLITVSISLLLFSVVVISAEQEVKWLYIIQGLNIVAVALDISWFFQGLEEFKKIVVRNVITRVLNILLLFICVKQESDLWKYALIIAGLALVGNACIWGYLKDYLGKVSIKDLQIKRHIHGIWQLFIPTIAVSVYRALDKTMIGMATVTATENGYYEQADKLVQMCIVVATALSTVMAPRIASTLAGKDEAMLKKYMYQTFDFLVLVTLPMVFGLMCVSDMVIPWYYGMEYGKVALLIKIFSPVIVFVAFSNAVGMQYLIQNRMQKIYTISISTGAILNFCINMVLIPHFYSVGAVIASVIAEAGILLVQLYHVTVKNETFQAKRVFAKLPKALLAATVMYVVLEIIKRNIAYTISSTIMVIVVGILVYAGVMFLLKDEMVVYGVSVIRTYIVKRIKRRK